MSEPAPLDTLGMWEAAAALPEQLSGALRVAGDAFSGTAPIGGGACRAVAAFGLGTGHMAATAAAALSARDLAVPFWQGDGSTVPAFVGADTLVLAVSSSGGTAETLDAAAEAGDRGATVVAVGGGPEGALARLADDAGFPWCPVHAGGAGGAGGTGGAGGESRSSARAALGAATVPLLVALARAGLRPDCAPTVQAASAVLARRRDALGGAWQRRGRAGASPRAHHPARLRFRRCGGRGRALVEGPGEPERQGAGVRGNPAERDARRVGRLGPGGRCDTPDDVARAATPCRRGAAGGLSVRRGPRGHRRGHGRHLRSAGRGRRRPDAPLRPGAPGSARLAAPRRPGRRRPRPGARGRGGPGRRVRPRNQRRGRRRVSSRAPRSWPCPGHRRRTWTRGRTSCQCPPARSAASS